LVGRWEEEKVRIVKSLSQRISISHTFYQVRYRQVLAIIFVGAAPTAAEVAVVVSEAKQHKSSIIEDETTVTL
jgi:hypothetical protein